MGAIFITGCSSGFGKATAELFLNKGWNVIATMRTPDPGIFDAPQDKLLIVPMDVTDEASIANAIQAGIDRFGQIDVLVNNAGIGLYSAFEVTPDATIRDIFDTNCFGVMAVTRAIIPHMRSNGAGTIVNVTSSVGIAPMPMVAVYCASKGAVESFSESLAYEMAAMGVRVKLVEPGYGPNTAFTANSLPRMAGLVSEPYHAYAGFLSSKRDTSGPTTSAEDVAEGVWQAVTDQSARLRFPAGPDSVDLAERRWGTADEAFLASMRPLFVPS